MVKYVIVMLVAALAAAWGPKRGRIGPTPVQPFNAEKTGSSI